jgi:hypothetical protein
MIRVEMKIAGLDPFTRSVVEEIAGQVKDHLQEFRCPVHGAEGEVTIRVTAEAIEPVACCDAGQEVVNGLIAGMG